MCLTYVFPPLFQVIQACQKRKKIDVGYHYAQRTALSGLDAGLQAGSATFSRPWPRLPWKTYPFDPPKGWLALRPRLCGICGSDLGLLRGLESPLLEPYASLPFILGHEMVAELEQDAPQLGLTAGTRVVVEPRLPCETRGLPPCPSCQAGRYNRCERFLDGDLPPGSALGFTRRAGGGMAERTAAHPSRLIAVPDGLCGGRGLTDSLARRCNPCSTISGRRGHRAHHRRGHRRAAGGAQPAWLRQPMPHPGGRAPSGRAGPGQSRQGRHGAGHPHTPNWPQASARATCRRALAAATSRAAWTWFLTAWDRRAPLAAGCWPWPPATYVMVGAGSRLTDVDISSLWFRELTIAGSSGCATGGPAIRAARAHPTPWPLNCWPPAASRPKDCSPTPSPSPTGSRPSDRLRQRTANSVKVAFSVRR